MGRVVHKAWGSGRWFPGSRRELAGAIEKYLAAATLPPVPGTIVAAIAPHAGYVYSGPTAGYTYAALKRDAEANGEPETVVVLGLCHRDSFQGVALMDGDAIATPLGEAPLDTEARRELSRLTALVFDDSAPHAGEHSAENQVPFIQAALPGSKLVVGLFGGHERQMIRELCAALTALAETKRIIVLASTDLLHDPDYQLVARTDKQTLAMMEAVDHPGILDHWDLAHQTCCGIGPVVAAMHFAESRGCTQGTVLHYRNSGDDVPESRGHWVVGYGAVAFAVR